MTLKKVPLRKCTGCQEKFPKKELIRLVKENDGNIKIDKTGKVNGRGAYLCKDLSCLEKAIKSGRLEKALKASLSENICEELKDHVEE